jgi:hypothetical protein
VTLHAALSAAATLVSLAFALSTLERYLARHKPQELAWTVSLLLFSAGSAALWFGAALGWSAWSFKAFYLFGAILNVPFLALGTVYLLASRRTADQVAATVSMLGAFAAGIVIEAPLRAPVPAEGLPQGKEIFGAGPRIAAALGSGVAATVIIGGALWSAGRLIANRRRGRSFPGAGRLAVANVFIAVGTLVLSAGGLLNSVLDEMDAFALSLVVGIAIVFVGFLLTNPPGGSTNESRGTDTGWRLPPHLSVERAA